MHSTIYVMLTNETTSVEFEPPLPPATGIRLVDFIGYLSNDVTIHCDLIDPNYSYTNIGCGTRGEVSKTVPSTLLGIIRRFHDEGDSSISLSSLNDPISRMTITLKPLVGDLNKKKIPIHVCLRITRY